MVSRHDRKIIELLLDEVHAALDTENDAEAESLLAEAEAIDRDDPDVRTLRAQLALAAGAHNVALSHALAALGTADIADAHYVAARVYEVRGDENERTKHDLEVLRLDAAEDLRYRTIARADVDAIEAMAESILASLPESVAKTVGTIPVVLEARPHPGIVEDGFDPRAVGLFEGGAFCLDSVVDRPVRIVVFYANLLATCRDDAELEEQLRITILHEIGHALGLDEDEVDALGLG